MDSSRPADPEAGGGPISARASAGHTPGASNARPWHDDCYFRWIWVRRMGQLSTGCGESRVHPRLKILGIVLSEEMVGTRRLELLTSTVSKRLSAVTYYTLTALTAIL